ncbi:MAG: hypothetical protein K5622_02525 [Endomicrobiaceae bacterium]|nr:hypothetical protein [Endomicrobiaceae bacterium]
MRKFFGLIFTLTILVFYSNILFAAFNPGDLATVNVVADFTSYGQADFSIELRNISNDKVTNEIGWTIQDVNLKQTTPQWKWSTTYAVIKSTVTDPRVSYYLYQKNTESTVYKSTAPRTNADESKVYSGLVNKDLQGGDYRGYIPLSYLFTVNKLSSSDLQKTYDPEVLTGEKVARYFTDAADSNFDKKYAIVACSNSGGIAFAPYDGSEYAPWAPEEVMRTKTAYMYFGGNFMNVFRGDIFGTDQICYIEQVIE